MTDCVIEDAVVSKYQSNILPLQTLGENHCEYWTFGEPGGPAGPAGPWDPVGPVSPLQPTTRKAKREMVSGVQPNALRQYIFKNSVTIYPFLELLIAVMYNAETIAHNV